MTVHMELMMKRIGKEEGLSKAKDVDFSQIIGKKNIEDVHDDELRRQKNLNDTLLIT